MLYTRIKERRRLKMNTDSKFIRIARPRRAQEDLTVVVTVVEGDIEKPLKHIIRHSPTGFEYGYSGSGPADLALSICHYFNKPELYQRFKEKVIAMLKPEEDYDIPFTDIESILNELESQRQA